MSWPYNKSRNRTLRSIAALRAQDLAPFESARVFGRCLKELELVGVQDALVDLPVHLVCRPRETAGGSVQADDIEGAASR